MTPFLTDDFAKALSKLDVVPLQHAAGRDGHFSRGFAVHRNNVQSAPIEALRQAFPVLQRLLGDEYFSALAQLYVGQNPPRSAVYLEYGADLADFIAAFPPLAKLGYLADIACLEWARLRAFHAADGLPLPVEALDAKGLERLMIEPLCWHPSVTLIESAHPLFRLWQSQIHTTATPSSAEWERESVLVWRQELALRTEPVTRPVADLLLAFKHGAYLNTLLAQPSLPVQDVMPCLARLLHEQVLCLASGNRTDHRIQGHTAPVESGESGAPEDGRAVAEAYGEEVRGNFAPLLVNGRRIISADQAAIV